MRFIVSILAALLLSIFATDGVSAQHRKLTVVLLRHAEKDLTDENTANPELSAAGKARAEKLAKTINKYEPDVIYSTDYLRTRATARPLARSRNAMTLIYDERNLNQMSDLIMSGKFKRVVVIGHNSTTPALVNMLIKQDKYKKLGEDEYDKIWIVKIRRYKRKPNKIKDKIIEY